MLGFDLLAQIAKGVILLKTFQTYPFEKLSLLLKGIQPNAEVIDLSIGEPQFDTPTPIQEALRDWAHLLKKYPSSKGMNSLKDAQRDFISRRFGVAPKAIIPTLGTREVLFNFPHFFLSDSLDPHIAYPNPFYQIYEGGAIGARAKSILMRLEKEHNFKPQLTARELQKVDLLILNSPNNPTGVALNLEELTHWVNLALEYDFVILSDECYSEIYESTPPPSILEASINAGNDTFKNILALNSISKRSCAPGLRSGFITGDEQILQSYAFYRTYIGCAIPLPLQEASRVAWLSSSEDTRSIYAQNLKIARETFPDTSISPYSFYIWLEVREDLEFTQILYRQSGIKVLPGSFLGREGAGSGFVRIALVYDPITIAQSLQKIKNIYDYFTKGDQ